MRWVADPLGHADPAFTLRVYAHAMRDEESDLSFAEFGGSKRIYRALENTGGEEESSNPLIPMARREGLEPPWSLRSHSPLVHRSRLPLRFEDRRKGKK